MRKRDYLVVRELKKKVSKVVDIIDMRVFGSRARGDESEYSDLDVFLEVDSLDKKTKNKISGIVWAVSYEHGLVISPFIITKNEIENSALKSSPIIKNILKEGLLV